MRSVLFSGATTAPPTITIIQSGAIRRRIAASDAVALLLSELAFGPTRRSDLATLSSVTAARVASASVGGL